MSIDTPLDALVLLAFLVPWTATGTNPLLRRRRSELEPASGSRGAAALCVLACGVVAAGVLFPLVVLLT